MSLPPVELLNDTHAFPGTYTFKVIGECDPFFPGRVAGAVQEEMKWNKEPAFSVRKSETGKHQSVTLEIEMKSAEEVHVVYKRLLNVPGVLLLL